MTDYTAALVEDIWTIFKGSEEIGRVISQRDAEAFISELKSSGSGKLRDRILGAVADAIEGEFDQEAD